MKQMNLKGIIWMIMVVLIMNLVSAGVTINSVTVPSSINEGGLLEASFLATTNENKSIQYYILLNNVPVASTNTYSWQTNYYDAGNYELKFIANTSISSAVETRLLEILNDPLTITIITPQAGSYNDANIDILVESKQADSCNYNLNNTGSGILSKNGIEFSTSITVSDNSHRLTVTCQNLEESKEKSMIFSTDSNAPIITTSKPSNSYASPIIGSTATLEVTTNEVATCKFDSSDMAYSSMDNTFGTTNSQNHYNTLTDIGEGEHVYYVRCQDSAGNAMGSSTIITFYTNKRPTALIDIDGSSPIRAGTYEIELTTNENLLSEPSLQYNFHNSVGMRPISLTGSGRKWNGYLIIDDSTSDSVGTFYYSGIDMSGLTGTQITSGKLFLVDTTAPRIVDSLKIEQVGKKLRLEWHFDDEEPSKYNVYRSMDSGVSYTDFYESTSSMVFEDNGVEEGVTYYYKVSVKDEAGNEGGLSLQVSGKIESGLVEAESLTPSLSAKVDTKIKEIESALLDVQWSLSELESATNAEQIEAIDKLSLIEKTKAMKSNIEGLKSNLESLKNLDLTEDDLKKRLDKLDASFNSQINGLVRSVTISDKFEYEQSFDESAFRKTLNEFALYKDITEDDELISESRKVREKITINSKIMTVVVEYFHGDETAKYTIISKTVTSPESLSSVSVVEDIPKSVEDNADDILFSQPPIILKKDPLVEWTFKDFSSATIYYVITGDVSISEAKKARTEVFSIPKIEQSTVVENSENGNDITGLVLDETSGRFSLSLVFMIIGIMTVAGLLIYYFYYLKEEEQSTVVEAPKIVKKSLPSAKSSRSFMDQATSFVPQRKSSSSHLAQLIERANNEADELNFNAVYKLYMSIRHLYAVEKFSGEHARANARLEISKVYSKILLFSKIKQCNEFLEQKNLTMLVQTLDELKPILEIHEGDNSYFYAYVKMLYDHISISTLGLGHISKKC